MTYAQRQLFRDDTEEYFGRRRYKALLTASVNRKGVLDVDTVKGCTLGMAVYPNGGCYGVCYAATTASQYGVEFCTSISRRPAPWSWRAIWRTVKEHRAPWYRIGTAGDPCHDWENTLATCEMLESTGKQPVIITKHWRLIDDGHLARLRSLGAVVNTSVSALDTRQELRHRLKQITRLREAGIRSVARVVTCHFGNTEWARERNETQQSLLQLSPMIDNPLRIPANDARVVNGDLAVSKVSNAGACGYGYVASEIRQNQCDANNAICSEFNDVRWIKSNSAEYSPEGEFDMVFTCPPYYRVERYVDYDGNPPPGEINSLPSYDEFMAILFAGYRRAIDALKDNRFFVVMTGDSRDKNGAYYCHEADTELFFKRSGLSIYNRIVYLEAEFTRLAHAKKTLHLRKFPKREQKIIVAYKGKIADIGKHFAPVGRL